MWNTWNLAAGETVPHIFEWVRTVATGATGGKLRALVVNCHGAPGMLQMGVGGLWRSNVSWFRQWRDKIDKIWLTACQPGFIQAPGSASDGNYVVASTETQWFIANQTYPFGQIDSYEGLVLSYSPDGAVSWSHRYDSNWSGNRE